MLHLANGQIADGTALSALTAARQARQAFVPAIVALEIAQEAVAEFSVELSCINI